MTGTRQKASLELLFNVSRELASALDLRTVLQRILFQSLKYVGGERGSIVVLDDDGKPLDSAIVFGSNVQINTTQQLRETIERGLAGWVVRNRKPVWVTDTSTDERWLQRPDDSKDQSGPKAAFCVPLLARERLVGVLTLVHPTPGKYTQEHFELMQAISDQAGIAVMNARLYAESQRQARVMTALAAIAKDLNTSLNLDEVLQLILNETIRAMEVETVALALVEANWDLVFRAATGENTGGILGKRVPSGRGIVGWVVHKGEGLVIPVVKEDKRFLPSVDQFEGIDTRAMAIAPIFARDRVIGVLQAINPRSRAFDPDALQVLSGIGNLAGSTIQHAQLFERLQAAHKRYRELFDDSMDAILITAWDGSIHEVNQQASVISGLPPAELQDLQVNDLHTPLAEREVNFLDRLKSGETVSYEASLKCARGNVIPIQVQVRKMIFEDTESLQWLMRDISERKDLDRLREDMTSMIYHDLRSPLANIISSMDLLLSMTAGQQNGSLQSVITIARRSTDRIQRLASSLLDINRLESGLAVISQKSVSPELLSTEAIEAVQPMTDSRSQTLENLVPETLPAIWVEADMIQRVLINLLENASKFTPPEGRIELGAKTVSGMLEMWVQDNGPGIPLKDQERIFDKFTRLKGERATGLGVGLAFCRLAVEGHGGKIWMVSEPGRGARFILTLPLLKE